MKKGVDSTFLLPHLSKHSVILVYITIHSNSFFVDNWGSEIPLFSFGIKADVITRSVNINYESRHFSANISANSSLKSQFLSELRGFYSLISDINLFRSQSREFFPLWKWHNGRAKNRQAKFPTISDSNGRIEGNKSPPNARSIVGEIVTYWVSKRVFLIYAETLNHYSAFLIFGLWNG